MDRFDSLTLSNGSEFQNENFPIPSVFSISGSQITYPKLLSSPLPLPILFLSSAQLTWATCLGPAALSLGAGGGHTAYIYR